MAYFSVGMMFVSSCQLGVFLLFIFRFDTETRTGTRNRIHPIVSRPNITIFFTGFSFIGFWATKAWIHFEIGDDDSLYTHWTFSTLPLLKIFMQTIQYGFLLRSHDRSVEIIDSISPDLFKVVQTSMTVAAVITYAPVALAILVTFDFSLDVLIVIRLVVRGLTIASIVGAVALDVVFLVSYILFLEKTKRNDSQEEAIDHTFLVVAKHGVLGTSLFFISACFQFVFFATNYERWAIINAALLNVVFTVLLATKFVLHYERMIKKKEMESKLERVLGCELAAIRGRFSKLRCQDDPNQTVVDVSFK
ncbi:hypothetical protein BCR33DRAFT_719334 [Rhizoclosmatium globosum]|uniref:Uncharacterized protein n=1 Tax=Rhizoclosmatium globosum TaxID=329046 RepID=A0A1Y2C3D1_9FUNG|nr:hypothetical protein BCR33DRAFT_719334 [Rhizoclosmatium globosum]|eukprot:ORY40815.1 hypothetical protein BCR33DRAFT_719334 [Rhizoclosmatium globosum]